MESERLQCAKGGRVKGTRTHRLTRLPAAVFRIQRQPKT